MPQDTAFNFAEIADSDILTRIEEAKIFKNVPWFGPGTYRAVGTDLSVWQTNKNLQMIGWTFRITESQSTARELDTEGNETDKIITADLPGSYRSYKLAVNDPDPKKSGIRNLVDMLATSYGWGIEETKITAKNLIGIIQILTFCQNLSPGDIQRYKEKTAEEIGGSEMDKYKFLAGKKYVQLLDEARRLFQEFVDNFIGVEFEVIGFLKMKKHPSKDTYTAYRWNRITPIEEE